MASRIENVDSRGFIAKFLDGWRSTRPEEIREAIPLGASSDPDAKLAGNQNQAFFRQVGENQIGNNDFELVTHRKMQMMARKLYHLNGLAANIIDILVDFTIGEGLGLRAVVPATTDEDDKKSKKTPPSKNTVSEAEPPPPPPPPKGPGMPPPPPKKEKPKEVDPQVEEFNERLQEYMKRKTNGFTEEQDAWASLLFIEGETLVPVTQINKVNGDVSYGSIENERLHAIELSPSGIPMIALVDSPDKVAEKERWFLLNSVKEDDEFDITTGGVTLTRMTDDGEGELVEKKFQFKGIAFYFYVTRVRGATRGKSVLARALDYLDVHDEVLWAFADAAKSGFNYFTHATFKGVESSKEIKKLMKAMGLLSPPDIGEVVGTNESVEFESITPRASSTALDRLERILRVNVAGSVGIPEGWTGGGADKTGIQSAAAQNTVQFRRLRRIQKKVLRYVRMMVDFQVMQWKAKDELKEDFDAEYEIVRTSLDEKDRANLATTLRDVVVALETVSETLVSRELANKVLITILREAGFEISEEEARIPEKQESPAMEMMRAGIQPPGGKEDAGRQGLGKPGGGQSQLFARKTPTPGKSRGSTAA